MNPQIGGDLIDVLHFTRVEHLPTIATDGLLPDSAAKASGVLDIEIGNTDIKNQRMRQQVPVPPGGVVADYVPFYYAPRSPMMFSIHKGNVPTYSDGCGKLVYLVSTVEKLRAASVQLLFTDRNAALAYAEFTDDLSQIDDLIDWDLMKARMWKNTAEDGDRMERRMAECLAHPIVPWDAVTEIVTQNDSCKAEAARLLGNVGAMKPINVRPDWYF